MTLESIRTLTPFITLSLVVGMSIIGWLVRWLIAENVHHFRDLKQDLKDQIDAQSRELAHQRIRKMELDLDKLEMSRLADQQYLHQQFISKDGFYRTVGRTESSIGRIFKLINELSKVVNRSIGARSHDHD